MLGFCQFVLYLGVGQLVVVQRLGRYLYYFDLVLEVLDIKGFLFIASCAICKVLETYIKESILLRLNRIHVPNLFFVQTRNASASVLNWRQLSDAKMFVTRSLCIDGPLRIGFYLAAWLLAN